METDDSGKTEILNEDANLPALPRNPYAKSATDMNNNEPEDFQVATNLTDSSNIHNPRNICEPEDQPIATTSTNASDIPLTPTASTNAPSTASTSATPTATTNKRLGPADRVRSLGTFRTPVKRVPSRVRHRDSARKSQSGQRAEILTSSPFQSKLEEEVKQKNEKEIAKEKRRIAKEERSQKLKSKPDEKHGKGKRIIAKNAKPKPPRGRIQNPPADINPVCPYCRESYDDDWISCQICSEWAHAKCTADEDAVSYICDYCNDL